MGDEWRVSEYYLSWVSDQPWVKSDSLWWCTSHFWINDHEGPEFMWCKADDLESKN